jgi:hypothetical protein
MLDLDQSGIDSSAFHLRNGSLELEIRFGSEALASITQEIGTGFLSIPRRGAEVGGILAGELARRGSGETAQQDSEWLVTIDQVVPAPIEYQYGPSYRLSAGDKQQFRECIQSAPAGARLIGWYRSNTRPAHEPDEADREISQSFFGGDQSIFLFCEPSIDGRIRATCIIMLPRRKEVAFLFDLGHFLRLERPLHCRLATEPASVNLPPVPVPRTPPALEKPPVRETGQSTAGYAFTWRYTRIAAGALALVICAWYARSRTVSAPDHAGVVAAAASPPRAIADSTLLGLRADYQANLLLIGWDRSSPAIASAASATFTITDGARTRILNLGARELRHGSILYKPHADEIKVELSVTSPAGRSASQSIRILGADPAPAAAAEVQKAPRVIAQMPVPGDAHPEDIPANAAPPTSFVAPPQEAPPQPRLIATPDAPNINVGAPRLIAGNLSTNITLPAPPKPAAGSRELRPATPLHAPQPSLPAGVNLPDYAFDRPFQVQVEVSISAGGRVTDAHLVGSAGPYASLLGAWALNTARLWTFHPATLGGESIPSTIVLTFHYSRPR